MTVDVWYASTRDKATCEWASAHADLLSPEERNRHGRYRFSKDRNQFLVSRVLLRTVLSRYDSVTPDRWRIVTGRLGRPWLSIEQNAKELRFNLAHCTGLVVGAFVRKWDIGIDCEDTSRSVNAIELARRYFDAEEVRYLENLPSSARRASFFEFWTLKEAYLKALGTGLTEPLDRAVFQLSPSLPPQVGFSTEVDDDEEAWHFNQPVIPGPYQVAVAVRCPSAPSIQVVVRKVRLVADVS